MSTPEIVECPTSEGCHYDYDRQTWIDGHDHYHVIRGSIVPMYCGQALAGCKRASGDWLVSNAGQRREPRLSAMPALAADVPSILAAREFVADHQDVVADRTIAMADAVWDLSEGLSDTEWHDCLDDLAVILAAHRDGEATR